MKIKDETKLRSIENKTDDKKQREWLQLQVGTLMR